MKFRAIKAIGRFMEKLFTTALDDVLYVRTVDLTESSSNNLEYDKQMNAVRAANSTKSSSNNLSEDDRKMNAVSAANSTDNGSSINTQNSGNNFPEYVRVGFETMSSKLWCEKLLVLTTGLKNLNNEKSLGNEKKKHKLSLTHIKQKLRGERHCLKKQRCYKLKYFESYRTPTSNLDFEIFNNEDFQTIRDILRISDNEFKEAFDGFYDKKDVNFNTVLSTDSKFRLRFIQGDDAFFLYKHIGAYKIHLTNNRSTAIQPFIALFRVGSSFIAIEYIDYDCEKLQDKTRIYGKGGPEIEMVHVNGNDDVFADFERLDRIQKKRGVPKNFKQLQQFTPYTYKLVEDFPIDEPDERHSRICRVYTNPTCMKKRLLADLEFFKQINANSYQLTLGTKDE